VADYHVWSTITYVPPGRYVVVASAVTVDEARAAQADVRQAFAETMEEAEGVRRALMIELGAAVRARGDRVVDVVDG
jgi:hypothetical protein